MAREPATTDSETSGPDEGTEGPGLAIVPLCLFHWQLALKEKLLLVLVLGRNFTFPSPHFSIRNHQHARYSSGV